MLSYYARKSSIDLINHTIHCDLFRRITSLYDNLLPSYQNLCPKCTKWLRHDTVTDSGLFPPKHYLKILWKSEHSLYKRYKRKRKWVFLITEAETNLHFSTFLGRTRFNSRNAPTASSLLHQVKQNFCYKRWLIDGLRR